MMKKNDVYTELATKLGVPNSERFLKVLDAMFTPEEAEICRELFAPATCQELAARLNVGEKDLSPKLDTYQRENTVWLSHEPHSVPP
jgi:hypothetical protein